MTTLDSQGDPIVRVPKIVDLLLYTGNRCLKSGTAGRALGPAPSGPSPAGPEPGRGLSKFSTTKACHFYFFLQNDK